MLPEMSFDVYPIIVTIGVIMAFVYVEIYFHKLNMKRGVATFYEIIASGSVAFGALSAVLLQNLYDYIENPSTYTWTWAMTFYGGIMGGVVCFFALYAIFHKKYPHTIKAIYIIAPASITVAHGIGRIGCFLDGCCYGLPTDSPLGLVFRTTNGVKVWPTNLWEAIFLLALSVVLLLLALKKNTRLCFPIFMISYGAWRFGIEYLRGDDRGSFIPGISPSQFWSIILFVAGIGLLIYVLSTPQKALDISLLPHNEKEVVNSNSEVKK